MQIVTADGAARARERATRTPTCSGRVRGGSGAVRRGRGLDRDRPPPYADIFAGMLLWDATAPRRSRHAWAAWTATAPETATTTLRVLNFPPMPELPPFLSGRSRGRHRRGDPRDGCRGIRSAGTAARAAAGDGHVRAHPRRRSDRRAPGPAGADARRDARTRCSRRCRRTPSTPSSRSAADAGLFVTELRHIGGALTRRPADAGAVGSLAGELHRAHHRDRPGPARRRPARTRPCAPAWRRWTRGTSTRSR